MLKRFTSIFLILLFLLQFLIADSPAVRVKDIATVFGARSNQLVGFGLVVGLDGSGDTNKAVFTQKAFTTLLANMGMSRDSDVFKSRNVAAVMVTADLPPFVKPGQRIDVIVSSVGDANSLKGGTLLQTPLKGADNSVYTVAQGQVVINGSDDDHRKRNDVETVGRVVAGGIVEKEVKATLYDKNSLKILVHKPDFSTAVRLADSLDRGGFSGSKAIDAATIEVPLTVDDKENIVAFISQIEDFLVVPDSIAKVVIDQKTGTIVIGENVRLAPVAVSHASFDIRIEEVMGDNAENSLFADTEETTTKNIKPRVQLVQIEAGSSLSSLVNALNTVGASPKDLVAIVQALKSAGALTAEVEVI